MATENNLKIVKIFRLVSTRSIYSLILRLVSTMASWQSIEDKTEAALGSCLVELLNLPQNSKEATRFKEFSTLEEFNYKLTKVVVSLEQNMFELIFIDPKRETLSMARIQIAERIAATRAMPTSLVRDIFLRDTSLSPRTQRAFRRNKIETFAHLFDKAGTRAEMMKLPSIGPQAVREVEIELNGMGIELK